METDTQLDLLLEEVDGLIKHHFVRPEPKRRFLSILEAMAMGAKLRSYQSFAVDDLREEPDGLQRLVSSEADWDDLAVWDTFRHFVIKHIGCNRYPRLEIGELWCEDKWGGCFLVCSGNNGTTFIDHVIYAAHEGFPIRMPMRQEQDGTLESYEEVRHWMIQRAEAFGVDLSDGWSSKLPLRVTRKRTRDIGTAFFLQPYIPSRSLQGGLLTFAVHDAVDLGLASYRAHSSQSLRRHVTICLAGHALRTIYRAGAHESEEGG